jgi:ribosomal protein S18 acetylase RimI-like enzyme
MADHDPVSIRTATTRDLDALVASAAALFAEDGGRRDEHLDCSWPVREGHAYYREALVDPATLCLLAVGTDPGEAVVGHLVGRLRRHDPLRPAAVAAVLESIRVAERQRAAGAGTRLHDSFLAWARQRGANEVTVQAYASNTPAISFYQSRGYAPHHVELRQPLVVRR